MEEGTTKNPGFNLYALNGALKKTGRDLTEDIVLAPVSHMADKNNILYLSFNAENPFTLQEDSGKYTIYSSSYIKSSDAVSGNAAHFSRLENKVVINSSEHSWPLVKPIKDFTLEMWIKPYHFYEKNEIFRKMGSLDGRKIGMKILIEREKLICRFSSLFLDGDGRRYDFTLKSRSSIKTNRWTHLAVSFNAVTGKLTLLVNDREEDAAFAAFQSSIGEMSFHSLDHSPIVVGEIYSGIIDELRISGSSRTESFNPAASRYEPLVLNYGSRQGAQKKGSVVSEVIQVPDSQSGKFQYDAEEPEGSMLDFKVRTSRKRFYPDTPESELPWMRIQKRTDHLPPFRYIQWMAEMKSDPEGKTSPVLKNVSIHYSVQKKPSPPDNLKIIPEALINGRICLEWDESPEVRLNPGAGYRIYYGLRPNHYTGKLYYNLNGESLIRGDRAASLTLSEAETHEKKYRPEVLNQRLKGKIRQCLSNELVEWNIFRIDPSIPMPFFRNTNTYYFSVTSWTKEGGESSLSEEIYAVLKGKPDL